MEIVSAISSPIGGRKKSPTPSVFSPFVVGGERYNVLVVDDDPLIGVTWRTLREKLNINELHYFSKLEDLKKSEIDFSVIDMAFVDKNFENSKYNGSAVVFWLKEKGISKIILASGEEGMKIPEKLENLI